MGFRKASNVTSEQVFALENCTSTWAISEVDLTAEERAWDLFRQENGVPAAKDASCKNGKPGEDIFGPPPHCPKVNSESRNVSVPSDQATWSKVGRSRFIPKEGTISKSSAPSSKRTKQLPWFKE